jgi:hypothetical protein
MIARPGIAAKTVFGRKDSGHVESVFDKHVEQMPVAHPSRVIGKESHAPVFQQMKISVGTFRADPDTRLRPHQRGATQIDSYEQYSFHWMINFMFF